MMISEADKNFIYDLITPVESASDEVQEGYLRVVYYLEQVIRNTITWSN
jgi:hypothetical protein